MPDYTRPGLPKSDPSLLRLQLIGPMQALTLDNETVLPPGRKTRGLLAILAMSGRRPVLRSKLAEMLWSRRSEEQARASLRQEIHRLLDALAPVGAPIISVERHSLALRPALTAVDAERLLNANVNHVLAQASVKATTRSGGGSSGAAGGAYALPPLDGVLLEELNGTDPALDIWLDAERGRLRQHALGLFEAALQRRPDPVPAIAICQQLLLLDPLHEAAWRGLIRGQLLQGERGAALQSANRCAALFSKRVSGEPGPETSRLLAELRSGGSAASEGGVGDGGRDLSGAEGFDASLDAQPAYAGPPGAGHAHGSDSVVGAEEQSVVSMTRHRLQGRSVATLAVLPALDLDAGANDKLVPALTDELIAGLAMRPILSVISGSALSHSLAQGRDDALLRRSFGLDYVLDGTILRGRRRIRIILRLLDLRLQGHVVWAKRFDCDPGDAMVRLDDVASMVSAQLPWELLVIESRRVGNRPSGELGAAQLTLRAFAMIMRPERSQSDKAGELLSRAESLDPDHPLIATINAMRHFIRAVQLWGDFANEGRLAEAAVHKALESGQVTPTSIALAGFIRGALLHDARGGLALINRSIALDANQSIAQAFAAFVLIRLGELDEAARRFALYKRLSPLHPMHYMFDGMAVTLALLQGRNEDAAALGRELIELTPSLLYPAIPCLAAFGKLGLSSDAERLLARVTGLVPDLSIDRVLELMQLERAVDRDCIAGGLQAAGLARSSQGHAGAGAAGRDGGNDAPRPEADPISRPEADPTSRPEADPTSRPEADSAVAGDTGVRLAT